MAYAPKQWLGKGIGFKRRFQAEPANLRSGVPRDEDWKSQPRDALFEIRMSRGGKHFLVYLDAADVSSLSRSLWSVVDESVRLELMMMQIKRVTSKAQRVARRAKSAR